MDDLDEYYDPDLDLMEAPELKKLMERVEESKDWSVIQAILTPGSDSVIPDWIIYLQNDYHDPLFVDEDLAERRRRYEERVKAVSVSRSTIEYGSIFIEPVDPVTLTGNGDAVAYNGMAAVYEWLGI